MKRLQILITLLLTVGFAIGQTVYPIRTFTVVNAPAPYALSGFASEPGRVQLNILTDDIALDRYAVKFRLTIQGNGLKLFTKPDFHQQPFYLDGGVTQTLTGLDLEALFNPDNLVFEGYSASEYRRNGRLPEGVYRVWVDLLDYYRGMQVSQSLPGMAMIYLTRAPRLSFPLPGTEIDPLVEPNIRFAWMGSLPADPLADVVYQFRLWETRPEGRDPYEVVAVSSPLFTQEVENPNFIYDMGMPPLTDGMTYVWQVRALDREGRALFQNSGLSNASTFRYGRSCPVPDVAITSVAHTSALVRWQGSQAAQLYRISYRPTRDSNWQHAETTASTHTFNNLADNTSYEVMVQAVCNGQEGDPGRVVGFKTTRQVDYTCGGKGGHFDLSNREPLPSLSRFDEFKAADFIVEVDEVTGQDGRFSGSGFALVPYLGFAKFMVTFNNIFVNADRRMTQGHIQFVVNDTTGLVLGLGTGKGNGNNGTTGITEVDPGKIADEVYTVDGDVTNITVTGNTVTVTNGDGTTQTIVVKDGNTVAVVPSSGGTVYVADQATGSVYTTPKTQAGGGKPGSVGTPSQTGQYNCGIDFKAPQQMRFGHDPVGNGKTKPDAYFRTNASGSRVGWKSLRAGDTDIIDLVPRGGCQADSLRYLRASGLATPTAPQGNGHRLLLGGLAAGDEDMLTVAVAKTQHINDTTKREILTEAGALGLVAYAPIVREVVLVPVNQAQCPQNPGIIKTELEKLFGAAMVDWQVAIAEPLQVDGVTPEGFKTSGNDDYARYTSDMKMVIKAFEKSGRKKRHTLYLFFVSATQGDRSGYMPLAGEYGFIFNFGSNTNVIGHELAHGAFNLRHTFSDKAQYHLPERTTLNLMDYANGTELWKYQWDLIHNPETILLGAYNEEEGAMTDDVFWINYFSRNITIHPDYTIGNDNLNYITPAGKPFVLPMSASVSFSGSFTNKSTNSTEQVAMPRGVLYAFADETGTYYANLTKKNGGQYYFNGYKKAKADGVFKESEVGGGSTHKVVVGIENESCRLFISGANYSFDQVALTKYRGDGPVLTVDALPVELTGHIAANISIPSGKCFPDVWYAIDPLSLDEFENGTYAKYNPYGNDYGLLVKLKDGRFVYSRVVSGGTTEYHVWNGKEWVQTMAPKAGCLSCELSELLTLWSFVQLAKEEGHTALDFVGAIPVAGELADGVNGIWYLVEGDRVNAGFSFASMLPLIGDAGVKGAKYVFKVGKDLKVVAGAVEAFSAIHKALKAKEAGLLVLCMDRSALLMGRHANHVETIRSLCVSVPDVGELEKVLKKLHDMAPEDCAKFLDDLATSDLSKNLEKVNVGLVESWKAVKAHHPELAKDINVLESFNNLRKNSLFSKMGLTEDIAAKISGTTGLGYKEIIDNLDKLGRKAAENGIDLIDFKKVVSDMLEGGGKVDGANWITKYLGDNADSFAGKKLKFEEFSSTELGGRYVDVCDVTNNNAKIFYEFKSVAEVPPGHFQAQFMKDLTNSNSLDQIKWVFNPDKNPIGSGGKSFREALLEEVDKLPVTDDMARKFLDSDAKADDLLEFIEIKFNEIFIK